jgi:hypothetical protein
MYKSDQISAELNIQGYGFTVRGTVTVVSDGWDVTDGRSRYDDYRQTKILHSRFRTLLCLDNLMRRNSCFTELRLFPAAFTLFTRFATFVAQIICMRN